MTVPTWPLTLPQAVQQDGVREAMADGRIKSPHDTGPPKLWLRSSAMPKPFSGTFWMTTAQLATFEDFIDVATAKGSLPFYFPEQRPGSTDTWLVQIDTESMPSWSVGGANLYFVSISLIILPQAGA